MKDIINTASQFVTSSVGRKILVALTGACLLLFLVGHLAGNMTVYASTEAGDPWINYYAQGLHAMPAWLLWSIRLGLLAVALVHMGFTLMLKYENVNARLNYQKEGTLKATLSSRSMVLTGVMIACFLVFHLWQLTINGDPADCKGHIVHAFSNPVCAIFYIAAICCLFMHVRHGFQSIFQTLGLATRKIRPLYDLAGIAFGVVVCGLYISIPVGVMIGFIK
ncbi:MAG: succinate dehydrogenase cytochrome b subunit [Akkermansia sp.]